MKIRETKEQIRWRMEALNLSEQKQIELLQIYETFSHDQNHFKKKKYSAEILKNMIYTFSDIKLVHLDKEYWNNPDIVDTSFEHSLEGLSYVSQDLIEQLLDCKESILREQLSERYMASDFLKYYPYEVTTVLFIKLALINPEIITPLKPKKVIAFLRDPLCRQYKNNLSLRTLKMVINLPFDDHRLNF